MTKRAAVKQDPGVGEAKLPSGIRYKLRFLRSHRKYQTGDVAVFDEAKAEIYLKDLREGGAFAEVVEVLGADDEQEEGSDE